MRRSLWERIRYGDAEDLLGTLVALALFAWIVFGSIVGP
jgi:hypothetical protein